MPYIYIVFLHLTEQQMQYVLDTKDFYFLYNLSCFFDNTLDCLGTICFILVTFLPLFSNGY